MSLHDIDSLCDIPQGSKQKDLTSRGDYTTVVLMSMGVLVRQSMCVHAYNLGKHEMCLHLYVPENQQFVKSNVQMF